MIWHSLRMSNEEEARELSGWFLRGALDLLVMRVLTSEAQHGFAISRRLAALSNQWLLLEEGSLYPCLYRLEKRGWIQSKPGTTENNRRARYYSLTSQGRQRLEAELVNWSDFKTVVDTVIQEA